MISRTQPNKAVPFGVREPTRQVGAGSVRNSCGKPPQFCLESENVTNGLNWALCLLAALGLVCTISAQETMSRGVVSGVVLDPADRGVAAAVIRLARRGTAGVTRNADNTGNFRFDGLAPGNY